MMAGNDHIIHDNSEIVGRVYPGEVSFREGEGETEEFYSFKWTTNYPFGYMVALTQRCLLEVGRGGEVLPVGLNMRRVDSVEEACEWIAEDFNLVRVSQMRKIQLIWLETYYGPKGIRVRQ